MSSNDEKRELRKDLLLASSMVSAGFVLSGLSLAEIAVRNPQTAQATQPLQSTPGADTNLPRRRQPARGRPS
jgi:hypothetical protein